MKFDPVNVVALYLIGLMVVGIGVSACTTREQVQDDVRKELITVVPRSGVECYILRGRSPALSCIRTDGLLPAEYH
jgi:hypothetical protein